MIDSKKALVWGIVNEIVAADKIEERVNEFASKLISKNASSSMANTKQMIAQIQTMDLNQALDYAAEKNAKGRESEDCKKGISAFLNKEKISW
jgi:methylglutaconyl-CoA hydratase